MKRLLALLPLVLLLTACGEKQDNATATPAKQHLTVVLDYFPNADHAPLYAAQAAGDFARAGLDVQLRAPSDPSAPLKLVEAGRADLAISYEPEVLLARDKGSEVVSVGALVQKPLTSIISLPSAKVRSAADLKGKTVGTAGIPYQKAYLETILKRAGVDPASVKQVDLGFNLVPALISKKADAVLGAFWNYEGVQLAQEKKHPQVLRIEQAGVPTYQELVIVGKRETLGQRGDVVRRFMQALAKGAQRVQDDPAAGVDPLVKANPDLDRKLQTAAVEATLPVLKPADRKQPFGYQDQGEWAAYGRWMVRNGLIAALPGARPFTNEFLPGEGL
jgi:putative hydroxymethylpyrimidine transport system substrate-binding protein